MRGTMNNQILFRDYIKDNILITDGAFGTYYAAVNDTQELPEFANTATPVKVLDIHRQYVEAGAKLIRTNTYAANTFSLGTDINGVRKNINAACEIARNAVKDSVCFIAGDIGPIAYDNIMHKSQIVQEYIEIVKCLLDNKLEIIVFETFSELEDIIPAIDYIKANSDAFVVVQFCVNQFGYSALGLSAKRLFNQAMSCENIDGVGFNCGVGPAHMQQIISGLDISGDKLITALANAGYPQTVSNRVVFASDNKKYFAAKAREMVSMGVSVIGGCCGTTPEYIRYVSKELSAMKPVNVSASQYEQIKKAAVTDNSFFANTKAGKKLIAVELAPPLDSDDQKLMEAAHILQRSGVDVLTFPDSPSGRTRADSILMAEKVSKETGLCVMPHICCRDKNAIAIRSQLLGAKLNGINNFLVITGDPIPTIARQTVKAVFNFDSVGLMNIISDMNTNQFSKSPLVYGGAINQNRLKLDLEINRVKKKQAMGATYFMTQPVFDKAGADKLKKIKECTNARILCGIMPFVSLKNASFMKNEMTGIEVSDEIIERYRNCQTKEEGEAVGVEIAREVIELTKEFVDGYYFSFPFNRVYLLDRIFN